MTDRLRVGDLPEDTTLYDTSGVSRRRGEHHILHLRRECTALADHSSPRTTSPAAQFDDSAICQWCLYHSDRFGLYRRHPTSGGE